ncbi:uncharacterized protein LOC124470397 [Hypomesus transpacificus]|uniref:uncharacterized protein LOC124470397 n=1 Tax=Hypomesus transpacificus TaxID=137520 RepID=UPI001F087838|nr:uncharacterized protein LOC124470397 [Hypomesus transpacificus]
MEGHRYMLLHSASIILAIASQLFSETFHVLGLELKTSDGLYRNSPAIVSETFPLDVAMDRWARYTWILVQAWNAAWLLHSAFTVFKRNTFSPLCYNPEIHPPAFFLMWVVINAARIGGMFLWDKQDLLGTLFFKLMVPFLSFFMLYMSYCNLYRHRAWLAINNPKEVWCTRYLTQNGLVMFAWWTLLETLVCLGVVLKHKAGLQDPMVSSVVLILILLGMMLWFAIQILFLSKYIRYTFTVYPVLVLGLGAMFTRGYHVHNLAPNTVYCGVLMLTATVLNCVLLIAACFYTDEASDSSDTHPHPPLDGCKTVCQQVGANSKEFAIANPVYCQN